MGSQPPFRQEKFRSDLNRPESYEMSERLLKTLRKSGDFQAEYEGSIPFTRSDPFRKIPIQEPIGDRMRRILKSYVGEAKTDDEWERAERELQKLETASG